MSSAVSNTLSLALTGAGYWGRNLARNFHSLGVLRTLCDPDQSALESYGGAYAGVLKTADYGEVLRDEGVTQVAIAAPAAQHFTLARAALEAGKDVFVEKPLCLDHAEGETLIRLAEERGRILMVGHLLRYHPCVVRLLEMVRAGELGRLCYVTSNRLNLGRIRAEENALWSFAPHDISVLLGLAGDTLPDQVRCVGEDHLTRGVADTTLTSFRFRNGLRAHIYVSWLNPFKEQKLTVVGSDGLAVFDDTQPWTEKLTVYRGYLTWSEGNVPTPNKKAAEIVEVEESEPLQNECRHFLDCCRARGVPRTDGQEGLRVLHVLQMAQQSLERDGEATGTITQPTSPVPDYFVHPTAVVDDGATIGKGTKVWHFTHVMKGAQIGERCVLGQNVNVAGGTKIGNNVKIQNNVSVYTGVEIEDDAFLGPSCVLTNVTNPRSEINRHSQYEKTLIRRGATIGANATIVCGVTLGRYCFIGAGAVVTKDVPDYALMVGNPARQKGWMSRHGHVLGPGDAQGVTTCPESGYRYRLEPASASESPSGERRLRCLDLVEDSRLPLDLPGSSRTDASCKAAAAGPRDAHGSILGS